jgi:hypothetical protein
MASIVSRTRNDGAKYYTAIVRVAGAQSKAASFDRKTDAKAWGLQTEAAIKDGRYFPNRSAERRTLGEAIDRYLRECVDDLKDACSRRRHLTWWKGEHGHLRLAAVTSDSLVAWRSDLAATGNAAATVNQKRAARPMNSR